ncbi:hypothetical protein BH10CYA1_BH10CYA1_29690 [soil metagenome]
MTVKFVIPACCIAYPRIMAGSLLHSLSSDKFIEKAYFLFRAREGSIHYSISTKTTEYPVAMRTSS